VKPYNDFSKLLNDELLQILKTTVKEEGIEAFIIGGFVRDAILGRKQKNDIDIVVLGSGIDLAKALQKKLPHAKPIQIFKTYGTAMIHWEGIDLEFVGARKESYSSESRNPKVTAGSLKDDQNRRDFTINAIYVNVKGQIFDFHNGVNDLKEKKN